MWKFMIILLLDFVFITKQSVEKPLTESELKDDDFLANLREILKDNEYSGTLNPQFMASPEERTDDGTNAKEKEKTRFMFTAKHEPYILVAASSTVKFNCSTNDPQSTYQLVHEHTMRPYTKETFKPDGYKYTQEGPIFSINDVNIKNDSGKYYCIARNQDGEEIQNDPYFLFISTQIFPNVKPHVRHPVSIAELGDDVTFTCESKGVGYSLKWEVKNANGVYVDAPPETVSRLPTRMGKGYVIQSIRLTLKDVRPPPYPESYRCCLDFYGDLRYSFARLEVKTPEKPKIINLPAYIGITAGSDFGFTCQATGSPAPMIMWSKDGEILESCTEAYSCHLKGNNYVISGKYNEELRLENANVEANSGTIVCHAMNILGMDERVTMIRIHDKDFTPDTHEDNSLEFGENLVRDHKNEHF